LSSKCYHEDIEKSGEMEGTPIDGVYVIACYCHACNTKVYEKYYYEGVIEDKEHPEN